MLTATLDESPDWVKTIVQARAWTMVRMDVTSLARNRVLLLLEQLQAEQGLTFHGAAVAAGLDASYAHKLRTGGRESIGHRQLGRVAEKLGLDPTFFSDPKLGAKPDYRASLLKTTRLERETERSPYAAFEQAIEDEGLTDPEILADLRGIRYRGGDEDATYAEALHQIGRLKAKQKGKTLESKAEPLQPRALAEGRRKLRR